MRAVSGARPDVLGAHHGFRGVLDAGRRRRRPLPVREAHMHRTVPFTSCLLTHYCILVSHAPIARALARTAHSGRTQTQTPTTHRSARGVLQDAHNAALLALLAERALGRRARRTARVLLRPGRLLHRARCACLHSHLPHRTLPTCTRARVCC